MYYAFINEKNFFKIETIKYNNDDKIWKSEPKLTFKN
jgi:hypothetical protein